MMLKGRGAAKMEISTLARPFLLKNILRSEYTGERKIHIGNEKYI